MKGVVIAGVGSGVGKTSISTGLMALFSEEMHVQGWKTCLYSWTDGRLIS